MPSSIRRFARACSTLAHARLSTDVIAKWVQTADSDRRHWKHNGTAELREVGIELHNVASWLATMANAMVDSKSCVVDAVACDSEALVSGDFALARHVSDLGGFNAPSVYGDRELAAIIRTREELCQLVGERDFRDYEQDTLATPAMAAGVRSLRETLEELHVLVAALYGDLPPELRAPKWDSTVLHVCTHAMRAKWGAKALAAKRSDLLESPEERRKATRVALSRVVSSVFVAVIRKALQGGMQADTAIEWLRRRRATIALELLPDDIIGFAVRIADLSPCKRGTHWKSFAQEIEHVVRLRHAPLGKGAKRRREQFETDCAALV
jgi:hypothetical protein